MGPVQDKYVCFVTEDSTPPNNPFPITLTALRDSERRELVHILSLNEPTGVLKRVTSSRDTAMPVQMIQGLIVLTMSHHNTLT